MAKKTNSKKKTAKKPVNTEKDNKIRYLEILIHYSISAMDGRSHMLDEIFMNQVKRLRFQIEGLNKVNQ